MDEPSQDAAAKLRDTASSEEAKLEDGTEDYEASLDELIEGLTADHKKALDDVDNGIAYENQTPVNKLPSENPTIKLFIHGVHDHSLEDVAMLPSEMKHQGHSLPDVESLKSARYISTRSKACRTCRLITTFFISNIKLLVIFGLSIALLLVLIRGSRGDVVVTQLRGGGYYTSPQNIESSVRSYVEREHLRHPDILGDALLHDPLSSQGKALQKTVQAGRMTDDVSSAIGTYVLWTINYQLFGNKVHDDGVTAGVWSNDEVGDVCLWRGVQCDNHGNVAVLDLEDRDVEGDLPPEVYLLKESLMGFSLKDNIEMGRNGMPRFLDQMTNLRYVNVCGTAYRGLDDASAFCASGTDKLIYAKFDCDCCVSCDNGSSKTSDEPDNVDKY